MKVRWNGDAAVCHAIAEANGGSAELVNGLELTVPAQVGQELVQSCAYFEDITPPAKTKTVATGGDPK